MSKGYDSQGKAVVYSYEGYEKNIKIRLFYGDMRGEVREEGQLQWLTVTPNVAIIRNIEMEKPYFLSISANSETKIKIEHFEYDSLEYTYNVPYNLTPQSSEEERVVNSENAIQIQFSLLPKDVGTVNDLTRIRFDNRYIDIFHEQKEGQSIPETRPGYRRSGDNIFYYSQDQNGHHIEKKIEFSVWKEVVYRDGSRPLAINWHSDSYAVVHNNRVSETSVWQIAANHLTKVNIQQFSVQNSTFTGVLPDNAEPDIEIPVNLGENGMFGCNIKSTLSQEEYNSDKRDLIRVWFDGHCIDFLFSTELWSPTRGTQARLTNCIKCNRPLKSS